MYRKRVLKESTATLEVAISKCLSQGRLLPSELLELETLSMTDLMIDHGLDSLMAEIVKTHMLSERLRQGAQSQFTWKSASRDNAEVFTRTDLVPENISKRSNNPIVENFLDTLGDITDFEDHSDRLSDDGRMLDYGDQKSDSKEGRMIRQQLYNMGQYANKLHDMLNDDDDLPQWCHYKIAVASNSLGKVKHYLEYKLTRKGSK